MSLGLFPSGAKAISFICGTTTAYLLNRRFTFQSAGGRARVAGFVLLYGTTFAINVGTNALMLAVLPAMPLRVSAAWVIAQGAGHRHQLRDAAHGGLPRLTQARWKRSSRPCRTSRSHRTNSRGLRLVTRKYHANRGSSASPTRRIPGCAVRKPRLRNV